MPRFWAIALAFLLIACGPGMELPDGGTCATTEERCGSICVNTNTNPDHCGGCGLACPGTSNNERRCVEGHCTLLCGNGRADCNANAADGCEANLQESALHCGACRRACSSGSNATPTCRAGTCAQTCLPGFGDCDNNATNGCETSTRTASHCGGCNVACDGATSLCLDEGTSARCVSACPSGTMRCGTSCVDTNTSLAHCGGCNLPCRNGPNANTSCVAGRCVATCIPGALDCDGSAVNGCETDPMNDDQHCGVCGRACAFGSVCIQGMCVQNAVVPPERCPYGQVRCEGMCRSLVSDDQHCGACGVRCPSEQRCLAGICASVRTELVGLRANAIPEPAALSSDGRYVFFATFTAHVADDTNNNVDVYRFDRVTNTYERSSVGVRTNARAWGHGPSASDDGRYVVFESDAPELVDGDTNGSIDVFLHDHALHRTTRISVSSEGRQAQGNSTSPSLSGNGRWVVYSSLAADLVANDRNDQSDVFLHDRLQQRTIRLSVNGMGAEGNRGSVHPIVSQQGEVVAFFSEATNFPTGSGRGTINLFLYQPSMGIRWIADAVPFSESSLAPGRPAALSSDGRFVGFLSEVPNLIPGDLLPGVDDLYVLDRGQNNNLTRESIATNDTQGDRNTDAPVLSGDGSIIVYCTQSSSLHIGDANGLIDVFARRRNERRTILLSVPPMPSVEFGHSMQPALSRDGTTVVFYTTVNRTPSYYLTRIP